MTPAQCRAARAFLGMTQPDLATAASLGLSTVVDFEKERRALPPLTVHAIRGALEASGILFLEAQDGLGEGLRLRKARRRR